MKQTKIMMGMTIRIDIVDPQVTDENFDKVFSYFDWVDQKFSTYKETSEITAINKGLLKESDYSSEMKEVFDLSEKTKQETIGYFNIISRDGKIDPSGLVKGWAIHNAAKILWADGFRNFFIDAGGDIQVSGLEALGKPWTVGIRNPFSPDEIVKVLSIKDNKAVATSGNYIRGNHVYNPHKKEEKLDGIISFTVVGPNIYEADRFATAVFAMGIAGVNFLEKLDGFEGYAIDSSGIASFTSGFNQYVENN